MIDKAIKACFENAKAKGWNKTFWAFDLHGTILKPNFNQDKISTEFYPEAKEVMQMVSTRKDIVKILFTCSFPDQINQYIDFFKQHNIYFDYINQNPEVVDSSYGHYQNKFYFNVLLEDKAGFDADTDWDLVKKVISEF
jgi:hypothetical protein